jgi:hypothetical protein
LSFATDEGGFVLWPVTALFLLPYIRGMQLVAFGALPAIFFVFVKFVLPPIYDVLGTSGPRADVLGGAIITKLLYNLISPDFYLMALTDFGRSISVTLGIISPWEWLAVTALSAVICLAVANRAWIVVASSLSMAGSSIFLSMIDMANGPGNFLAQLTYYYHSMLAPLIVIWVASIYHWLRPLRVLRPVFVLAATAVIVFNFMNFQRVNELTKILHTYPLATLEPTTFDAPHLQDRFEYLLASGPLPQANGYRAQFAHYRDHPMGDGAYASNFLRSFDKR